MVYSWCIVGELYTIAKRPVHRHLRAAWCIGGQFSRKISFSSCLSKIFKVNEQLIRIGFVAFASNIQASCPKHIGYLHQTYRLFTCNIAYMYIVDIGFSHGEQPILTSSPQARLHVRSRSRQRQEPLRCMSAKAHRIAVEVSAYVCTQNGAMSKYPAELVAKVK